MPRKAIVIGLDGLEPTIVESMLERGELPHLARIRQARFLLAPKDYISRADADCVVIVFDRNQSRWTWNFRFYLAGPGDLSARRSPEPLGKTKEHFSPPRVVNNRMGIPLWRTLSDAGIPQRGLALPLHVSSG